MAIRTQRSVSRGGTTKVTYVVAVEAINKFTGRRIQKYRKNVDSLPKAKKIERSLWLECREGKPESFCFATGGN